MSVCDTLAGTVGEVEQCHGASTMTESVFLTDESSTKASMWGGFRCNRAFLMLLLINVIVFQSIVCECWSSYCAILVNIAAAMDN